MQQQTYITAATSASSTIVYQNGYTGFVYTGPPPNYGTQNAGAIVPHYGSQTAGAMVPQSSSVATYHNLFEENRLNRNSMEHHLRLRERNDLRIVIFHAKLAQKSSKTNKHYFCPPPCIFTLGNGWRYRQEEMLMRGQPGAQVCAFIEIENSDQGMQQINFNYNKQCFIADTLHISHSYKCKQITLSVKMFYGNGRYIGQFNSKTINVTTRLSRISALKNADMYIASGTCVALFQRSVLNVWIRYLHIYNGCFYGSSTTWSAFQVHLLDNDKPEEFQDGYVHYGATVKLVCSVTGTNSPRLVIRKVDKDFALLDDDGPVLQCDECAFYVKDTERMYLCLSQEKIFQSQATLCLSEPNKEVINSAATWNIIGTDKADYQFYSGTGPVRPPVTSVPRINSLNLNCAGSNAAMSGLNSNYITPQFDVNFGNVALEPMSRCVAPDISEFRGEWLRRDQSCRANNSGMKNVLCKICKIYCYSHKHLENHMKACEFRHKMSQIPFNSHVELPFGIGKRHQLANGQINNYPNSAEQPNRLPIYADVPIEQYPFGRDCLPNEIISKSHVKVHTPNEVQHKICQIPTKNALPDWNASKEKYISRVELPFSIGKHQQLANGQVNNYPHSAEQPNRLPIYADVPIEQNPSGKDCLPNEIISNSHVKVHTPNEVQHKICQIPTKNALADWNASKRKCIEVFGIENRQQLANGQIIKTPNSGEQPNPPPIYAEAPIEQNPSGKVCLPNESISKSHMKVHTLGEFRIKICQIPTKNALTDQDRSKGKCISRVELPFGIEERQQLANGHIINSPKSAKPHSPPSIYAEVPIERDPSGKDCLPNEIISESHMKVHTFGELRLKICQIPTKNALADTSKEKCISRVELPFGIEERQQLANTKINNSPNSAEQLNSPPIHADVPREQDKSEKARLPLVEWPSVNEECEGPMLEHQPNATTFNTEKRNRSKEPKIKRKRCGQCIGCWKKDNCGDCPPCKNDKSHQICKQRRCENIVNAKFKKPKIISKIRNISYRNKKNLSNHRKIELLQTEKIKKSQSKIKRKRCGQCIGCWKEDNCGDCPPCKNDKSHQVCKQRRCEDIVNAEPQKSKLSCEICNICCDNKENFRNHMKIHMEGKLTCEICHITTTERALAKHKISCYPDRNASQEECVSTVELPCIGEIEQHSNRQVNKAFRHSDEELDPHSIYAEKQDVQFDPSANDSVSSVDSPFEGFTISECEPHFTAVYGEIDSEEIYVCEKCGKTFERIWHLHLHLKSHRKLDYSCNGCSKKFSDELDLENHTETHNFECYICEKHFPSFSDLNSHINKHFVDERWVDPLSVTLSNWSPEKYRAILQNQPLVMVEQLDIDSINLNSLADQPSMIDQSHSKEVINQIVIDLSSEEIIDKNVADLSSDEIIDKVVIDVSSGEDSDVEIVDDNMEVCHCYFCDKKLYSLSSLGGHVKICNMKICVQNEIQ